MLASFYNGIVNGQSENTLSTSEEQKETCFLTSLIISIHYPSCHGHHAFLRNVGSFIYPYGIWKCYKVHPLKHHSVPSNHEFKDQPLVIVEAKIKLG